MKLANFQKLVLLINIKKMQFEKLGIKNIMQITVLGVHLYNFCYEFLFCLKCVWFEMLLMADFGSQPKLRHINMVET
jgi:hypothetical protein